MINDDEMMKCGQRTEDRRQKTEEERRKQICITSDLEGMQSNRKKNISDIRNTNMKLRINKDQSLLRGKKNGKQKKRGANKGQVLYGDEQG